MNKIVVYLKYVSCFYYSTYWSGVYILGKWIFFTISSMFPTVIVKTVLIDTFA